MISKYRRNKAHTKDFSQIATAKIMRSTFRRDHGYKTAFDAGKLIPIFVDEYYPGDTFNLSLTSVCRLATPTVPIMDNIRLDYFFFAVPNRLLWDNWKRFMGERDPNPSSSIDYTVPQITAPAGTGWTVGSLGDYFGIPIGIAGLASNALAFRAYNLIFNEWFRSQDLVNSVTVDKDDGPDDPADYVLLSRMKRYDYFTSALPWPEKQGEAVELPLGSEAKIHTAANTSGVINVYSDAAGAARDLYEPSPTGADQIEVHSGLTTAANYLYADLSAATASTIAEIREAFQLQKMLERDARGGTRYRELILSHFNVNSPDARQMRPEYLGGGRQYVNITPVAQTSEPSTDPVGTLGAIGFASGGNIGFTKSFTEHGVIIGMVCAVADLSYQQGMDRFWNRQTRYDYYWPSLSMLSEQPIYNKEIWADGSANDDLVFGYNERWAELRMKNSLITGVLRSDAASSLDVWHLAQDFAALPSLNGTFITEQPPISRVVAVPSEPEFIMDAFFRYTCTRPLPVFSTPGHLDHF